MGQRRRDYLLSKQREIRGIVTVRGLDSGNELETGGQAGQGGAALHLILCREAVRPTCIRRGRSSTVIGTG